MIYIDTKNLQTLHRNFSKQETLAKLEILFGFFMPKFTSENAFPIEI